MKLKDKIRDKLRLWLLEDDLFQVEAAKKSYNDAVEKYEYENRQLADTAITYKNSHKLVDDCHQLMNSMMDVGTDIHLHSDHSWAVVCIKGHPEYVSFMPLSSGDARDVIRFLQRFKYSDRVIDSPFGFKNMINDHIMDNPFVK